MPSHSLTYLNGIAKVLSFNNVPYVICLQSGSFALNLVTISSCLFLCYVMLCYVMLSYVMLCYVMYVMLCISYLLCYRVILMLCFAIINYAEIRETPTLKEYLIIPKHKPLVNRINYYIFIILILYKIHILFLYVYVILLKVYCEHR